MPPQLAVDLQATDLQLSELEFQDEVRRAKRDSNLALSAALRQHEPDVAMVRGLVPNAPEGACPALFARDLFFDELDHWRHAGCPRHSECLDAAERALRCKRQLAKHARDARTFVCAKGCPWRAVKPTRQDLPRFTPELIRFLESDSKNPLLQ